MTAEELMLVYQTHSPDEAYCAFNELYNRYGQRVFNFLNKKIKNFADTEDVLQKVFIKIHESKHLYKNKYKFEQWLFVIAKTQALDYFRSHKRYQDRLRKYEPEIIELAEIDMSILSSLDSDQQELLEMKFIARSQALDYFRSSKRYQDRLNKYEHELYEQEEDEVDMSVLINLDSDQLELLEMKFIDELSYQEISKIVNKSEVSLRKTLSRMLGRLNKEETL